MAKYKTRYGQPGLYNSSLPTIPNEEGGALAVDANGRIITSSSSGGGAPTSAIGDGVKTVTTAATRVTLAATTACRWVCITASLTNTGVIVVGGTTVVAASGATRRGTPLSAGDSVTLNIDDLNKVNLDATVSGEGVTFTYTT